MFRQVFDGEADTIAYPFQKTDIRTEVFDFSMALYNVGKYTFVICFGDIHKFSECNIVHRKMGEKSHSLWTFFTVYDNCKLLFLIVFTKFLDSWLVMLAILILQGLFYSKLISSKNCLLSTFLVANQYCQSNEPRISFQRAVDSVWLAVQIQLGQAVALTMKTYAGLFF